MSRAFYSVKCLSDGGAVVRARDVGAKQNFFGWGSDRNAVEGSFYGRGTHRGAGDNEVWEWKLSHEAVAEMIGLITLHGSDRNYYDERSAKIAQELLKKLRKCRDRKSHKGRYSP